LNDLGGMCYVNLQRIKSSTFTVYNYSSLFLERHPLTGRDDSKGACTLVTTTVYPTTIIPFCGHK